MLEDISKIPVRLGSVLRAPGIDRYKQRTLFVMLVVTGAFIILLGRLFYLQVIQGENFRRQSETNSVRLEYIAPTRGLIFDRNGKLLVDDRPSFDLTIVLKDAKPVAQTIENLSRYVDEGVKSFMQKIDQQKGGGPYQSILLKKDIGRNLLATVETHKYDLPGISVQVKPLRNYVNGKLAAHLIGYLSEISPKELNSDKYRENRSGDFIGKVGIEKAYEPFLRGTRGGRQVEVNALGRVARVLKTVPATPGDNIYLSIDEALQRKAEQLLAEQLLAGKVGAVVAMVPETGEILTLASSPAFDPNIFVSGLSFKQWNELSSNPNRPLENKVIQAEYAPGSIYKIVTALAGLEEGIIDEDTEFYCPGYLRFGDRSFHCWKPGGHGKVTLVRAIAESCDVYFYQVGLQLGVDRLAWYALGCGLGEPTGIDLDHEASGLIPTAAWKERLFKEDWQRGENLSIAIGQGADLVTPLQVVSLAAAIANGGDRMKPQIIRTIKSAEGKLVYQSRPELLGKLPVSRATLDLVKKGMRAVVAGIHGTAHAYASLPDIEISGKTGTAQVVGHKDDKAADGDNSSQNKAHAWFVAYAPSDQPRIAVAVIVEHGEHGSSTAAPIAKEIIKAYLGKPDDPVEVIDSGKDGDVE